MTHSALLKNPARPVVAANDPLLTMSSREIAGLVKVRHDSVKRSMERMRDQGVISFSPAVETSHDGAGARPVEVFNVGKRDSYVVVAQLSPQFTAALVDRWQELEDRAAAPAPAPAAPGDLSRLEILQIAMAAEEGRLAAEARVAKLEPQAAALHRLALQPTDATLCLTDAAKHLQLGPQKFIRWLLTNGWLYRRTEDSNLSARQDRLDKGYLVHKFAEYQGSGGAGDLRQARQVRVTQMGIAKLSHLIAKGKGPVQ